MNKKRNGDLNFECSVCLVHSKPWNKFAISFEGLSEIIDQLWRKYSLTQYMADSDLDEDFEMVIPKSCFSYYIWQHVYARIVEIKSFHQTLYSSGDTERFEKAVHLIKSSPVPVEIARYLAGIGDIKDTTGAEFVIDFPVWPNEQGHFGRVSGDTHYKYETMAAPFILAHRIMQDLAYTKYGGKATWNLPEELVPTEGNAGLPTNNLVGWDLRQKLNAKQKYEIESVGIKIDNFNSTIPQFMWNAQLFSRIKNWLMFPMKMVVNRKNTLMLGSCSQIPWLCKDEGGSYNTQKYTGSEMKLISCCKLKKRFLNEASLFCYRVRKDTSSSLDSYCCYDFNSYKEVPNDWRNTRNTVFEYGDVSIWNLSTFENWINRDNLISSVTKNKSNYFDTMYTVSFFKSFTVTFEGLPGIIDETYNLLNGNNKFFTDHVSRSVFSYYVWIHLYARIMRVADKRTLQLDSSGNDSYFAEPVRSCPIPSPIEKYLSFIGNVENNFAMNLTIDFPTWPNENGDFGSVNKDTHYKYETMAAPAVLAQRILEDLAYTKNSNAVKTWNLKDIRPIERNAGLPTKNLLGWGLREKLTPNQQSLIESAGITNDDFKVSHRRFMYNQCLFGSVIQYFSIFNVKVTEITKETEVEKGSLSQMLWQEKAECKEEVFDREIQYCERPLRLQSFCLQYSRIVMESLLCSFRVKKDRFGNLDSYCCYDFNEYKEVPDDWKDTRNKIFEYGDIRMWNEPKFKSAVTTKDPYRRKWVVDQLIT